MQKRNLFAELTEWFDALAQARAGQQTLRTHELEVKTEVQVTASELRTKPHTLENWEQG